MEKIKIDVLVETSERGKFFWCGSLQNVKGKIGLNGAGKSVQLAMQDIRLAAEEMRPELKEVGACPEDIEFNFILDVGAMFNLYPVNITSFAKYIGINPSLMRQYATGLKRPKEKQLARISEGVRRFAADMGSAHLITKDPMKYI